MKNNYKPRNVLFREDELERLHRVLGPDALSTFVRNAVMRTVDGIEQAVAQAPEGGAANTLVLAKNVAQFIPRTITVPNGCFDNGTRVVVVSLEAGAA